MILDAAKTIDLLRPSASRILDAETTGTMLMTPSLVRLSLPSSRSTSTPSVLRDRPPAVRDPDTDLILVMESGQIMKQGTHASLLAAGCWLLAAGGGLRSPV